MFAVSVNVNIAEKGQKLPGEKFPDIAARLENAEILRQQPQKSGKKDGSAQKGKNSDVFVRKAAQPENIISPRKRGNQKHRKRQPEPNQADFGCRSSEKAKVIFDFAVSGGSEAVVGRVVEKTAQQNQAAKQHQQGAKTAAGDFLQ